MRGRRPLPTAVKELAGNPGKRPLNKNEPKPEAIVPPCPPHLQGEARKEWRRITKELATLKLISKLDRAALSAYCAAWGRWVDAEEQLRKHGPVVKSPSGFPMQNPFLSIANTAMEQLRKYMVEFGLTPSSRSRIETTAQAPADEIQEFINES